MKKLLFTIVVLCCNSFVVAADLSATQPDAFRDAKAEISELKELIANAKATGETPDPAWMTRIEELLPPVKRHSGNVVHDLQSGRVDGGFEAGALIRPTELTPLEEQIRELELQARGGAQSQSVDEVTFASLKEQLNALYQQRPENRERNPLDQGSDNCPATVITGIPYTDTGTTVGRANDFNPISACNSTFAPDVVYEFTPTITDFYAISLMGSSYDTYLYVHTLGSCPGIFSVGCNDDNSPSLQSYLSLYLTAGQVYYIIVDGYNSSAGSYVLNITGNCSIECQPNDVPECAFEEIGGDPVFDCNYFCNGYNSIQGISLFQTVCGRTWATNGQHDQDWYYFQILEPCSLDITLRTEVPIRLQLNSFPSFDCNYTTYLNQFQAIPCSTLTYRVPCVQPGDYTLFLATDALNIAPDFREYRVRVNAIPCSGCRIDGFLQAPGTAVANTCGAGNNNPLRPSEDYTFFVNIPSNGEWRFSLCNGNDFWDSYIYLTPTCDGSPFYEDDDGCGFAGLSAINCAYLSSGSYYLTVEAYHTDCGQFELTVSSCYGRCCYGDPQSPGCEITSLSMCQTMGGLFTEGVTCDTPCPIRAECGNRSVVGQLPAMNSESPQAFTSHIDFSQIQYDNYVTPEPVGAVRFWGFTGTCSEFETFRLYFTDGGNTCEYTVTATGTLLPDLYFNSRYLSQYDVEIHPPCGIPSGLMSVAKVGDTDCPWTWVTSPFGDGTSSQPPYDFAFCLTPPCPAPDSVTINMLATPADAYTVRWHQQEAGVITLWWSTNPSAVFPTSYSADWSLYTPAGSFANTFFAPNPSNEVIFVLTLDCTPPTPGLTNQNPVLINRDESK